MIPAIVMTVVATRRREPTNYHQKLLRVIRVRRCHQVGWPVLLTFLVFINLLVGEDVLVGAGVIQKLENKSTTSADKPTKKSSESDSSDSSDSGGSSKSSASDGSDTESPSSSSDHSNGSDSSDEDEASANEKAPPKTKDKSPSTSESSSDSEDESDLNSQKENAPAVKRRKTSKDGVAVTTAVAAGLQQIARASQRKEKPPPKVKERFQRVKVQNVAPDLVLDNGYQARVGNEL